jgi:methionine-gamma-lyase
MKSTSQPAVETLIVHGCPSGNQPDVSPPIHMSSTFKFPSAETAANIFNGSAEGYIYSRIANPTVDLFQKKLMRLEGAEAGVAVSSGMAAVSSTALTLAKPGDNFVACTTIYGGTHAFFSDNLPQFGIQPRFVFPKPDLTKDELTGLIDEKTRFLFMETPANPTLSILDIGLWAEAANDHGIPLVVDNTFATPYLQQPIELGARLVVHSTTKYLGGHADLIGGAVVGNADLVERIRTEYVHHFGPILSPMNAWLLLRGMKTLAVRMDRHCANAEATARYLSAHPKVAEVYYPGLPSHPGHDIAKKQMKAFGGMISFEVKGGVTSGQQLMNSVRLCTLAVSLGDCDTLIQHPASMTHACYSREDRMNAGISDGLIRLSVGIENVNDIIADLDQALIKI